MNLGRNILNVLINQSKVYVKGLGGFNRIYISSKFDEENNIYLPPITYIEFDSQSKEGLDFVKYIQKVQQSDYSSAEEKVEAEVERIKSVLLKEESFLLEGLGYLMKYGEGIVFKPLDLTGFSFEPISDRNKPVGEMSGDSSIEDEETVIVDRESVIGGEEEEISGAAIQESENETLQAAPVEQVPVDNEGVREGQHEAELEEEIVLTEEHESPSSSHTVWYLITAVISLGVIGYFIYNYYQENLTQQKENHTTQITEELPIEQNIVLADTAGQDSLAQAIGQLDTLEEIDPYADHKYQIVIGSHKTMIQAEEQAEKFHKAGHMSVRVIPSVMPHNRKKVIWDSYVEKHELDSALRYVQKNFVKDAWPDQINK